ncbi:MAG TPA: choline ABC transporter ATP-binding protein [Steroidobacteraceae bacterium]|jgi:glycine betaine/proline transport system ATP-binding protein|nr:choline ABC transporter ATP-binding protein [Steroidobacteraceae bacterium]
MNSAIEFKDVDILFAAADRAGRVGLRDALAALDAGGTRTDIQDRYGVIVGVAGANLSVACGEISVLMGLSGSGKSTLLRAANGLNPVTRGHVLVRDGDSTIDVATCGTLQMRRLRRERVAVVFQQFGLLPWRTVRENVGFGLEVRGEAAEKRRTIVDEKLELVGLTKWAEHHVSELSGGMQQRVGLARAFATDADILLMDEPFSALDPLIRGKLQDELLTLQALVKKSILFVSHDLDEALRLGDRISILQNGRIIQTGTAEDIVLAPADDYVAEFVRHMNPLTVLTGGMIMQRRAHMAGDADCVWLDHGRRYRLSLNSADQAIELRLDGVSHSLCHIKDDSDLNQLASGVAVAPASLSLQSIIQLRQSTGHPVLLAEDGRILGVCGETEIIRALASGRP